MAENQVEVIKSRTDIVSLIDERVKLTRAGRNFKALCPFHGEKTASFFVSAELQLYKCFGCGVGGDVYAFLQAYEGMTFPEALEYLAKKAGVQLVRGYRKQEDEQRVRWLEALHLAEEFYHYLLTKHAVGKEALAYLKKRGVNDSLIRQFGLGYSPESWDSLYRYLVTKKRYKPEEVEMVGLIIRSTRYYDRFRGRVMFPLRDMRGRTVGFAGRLLEVDAKEAKYVNTPETPLYHKGTLLYGLSEARGAIKKKNRVVVVEGELDMLASFRAGVTETVAIKGSALTADQIELVRRLTTNLVLALDTDAAGSEATTRGIGMADKAGVNVSVVEVTGGKDPDEVVTKNPESWRKLVERSESVYDFLIGRAFRSYDVTTGEGKRRISRQVAPILAGIGNAVEREHYLKGVAEKLAVSEQVMAEEVAKAGTVGGTNGEDKAPVAEGLAKMRREKLERYLLGLFFQLGEDIPEAVTAVEIDCVAEPAVKAIWQEVVGAVASRVTTVEKIVERLEFAQRRLVETLFTSQTVTIEPDKRVVIFRKGWQELVRLALKEKLVTLTSRLAELTNEGKRGEIETLRTEVGSLNAELKKMETV